MERQLSFFQILLLRNSIPQQQYFIQKTHTNKHENQQHWQPMQVRLQLGMHFMFQTPAVQFMIRRIYLLAETSSEIKNILHAEMKFLTLSSSDLAQSAVCMRRWCDLIWLWCRIRHKLFINFLYYSSRKIQNLYCTPTGVNMRAVFWLGTWVLWFLKTTISLSRFK